MNELKKLNEIEIMCGSAIQHHTRQAIVFSSLIYIEFRRDDDHHHHEEISTWVR